MCWEGSKVYLFLGAVSSCLTCSGTHGTNNKRLPSLNIPTLESHVACSKKSPALAPLSSEASTINSCTVRSKGSLDSHVGAASTISPEDSNSNPWKIGGDSLAGALHDVCFSVLLLAMQYHQHPSVSSWQS